ncbi:hypothetical protein L1887_50180 [Cichorium endivia]|nr:hypothetical protein L1887_50180 [Cichorium endivia]
MNELALVRARLELLVGRHRLVAALLILLGAVCTTIQVAVALNFSGVGRATTEGASSEDLIGKLGGKHDMLHRERAGRGGETFRNGGAVSASPSTLFVHLSSAALWSLAECRAVSAFRPHPVPWIPTLSKLVPARDGRARQGTAWERFFPSWRCQGAHALAMIFLNCMSQGSPSFVPFQGTDRQTANRKTGSQGVHEEAQVSRKMLPRATWSQALATTVKLPGDSEGRHDTMGNFKVWPRSKTARERALLEVGDAASSLTYGMQRAAAVARTACNGLQMASGTRMAVAPRGRRRHATAEAPGLLYSISSTAQRSGR